MSFEEVLKCGSNFEMSPACAETSSFFWVVWAIARARERGRNGPGGPEGGGAFEKMCGE